MGIISGVTDDNGNLNFSPDDPITRAEALKILLNAAHIDISSAPTTTSFTDVGEDWEIPYIETAKSLGIVDGQTADDGSLVFRPDDTITRAESAKILFKVNVQQ